MSVVGDNIARATAAGIRAAQMAPFVHCEPRLRDVIRNSLRSGREPGAQSLLAELEQEWDAQDLARFAAYHGLRGRP